MCCYMTVHDPLPAFPGLGRNKPELGASFIPTDRTPPTSTQHVSESWSSRMTREARHRSLIHRSTVIPLMRLERRYLFLGLSN